MVTEGNGDGNPVLHILQVDREGGDPEKGDAGHWDHHVEDDEVRLAADARAQMDGAEAALARRADLVRVRVRVRVG